MKLKITNGGKYYEKDDSPHRGSSTHLDRHPGFRQPLGRLLELSDGRQMAGYHGGNYQGFSGRTTQLRQELAAKQGEYHKH